MEKIYRRRIKAITGNGTGQLKIFPTPRKRVHGILLNITFAGGTTAIDTLAEQLDVISEIRYLVGTAVRRRLTKFTLNTDVIGAGAQLRDYMLLNGTQHDFDAISTYVAQVYLPFAEDWFFAPVADALAWNPAALGGDISVEIDCDSPYTMTVTAVQLISDDLDADSAGIITWETIKPSAGSTSFFVEKEIKLRGKLIQASIYPDTGGAQEITPASVFWGDDETYAWEALTSAENDDQLARFGLTPAASGRTANIYDIVWVRGDALQHALPMDRAIKLKVEAASAMTGVTPILLARLEPNRLP